MTAKTAGYFIDDDGELLGVVRCPDGDVVTFERHAHYLMEERGIEGPIEPPVWRWYRMNPDPSGQYNWMLGRPDGPGRGNWRGAAVRRPA